MNNMIYFKEKKLKNLNNQRYLILTFYEVITNAGTNKTIPETIDLIAKNNLGKNYVVKSYEYSKSTDHVIVYCEEAEDA